MALGFIIYVYSQVGWATNRLIIISTLQFPYSTLVAHYIIDSWLSDKFTIIYYTISNLIFYYILLYSKKSDIYTSVLSLGARGRQLATLNSGCK